MKCRYILNPILTYDVAPSITERREQCTVGEGEGRTQKIDEELNLSSDCVTPGMLSRSSCCTAQQIQQV